MSLEQNASRPPQWLVLLPLLPVVPGIGMAEAGLRRISSGSDLGPAAMWMCQTTITGYIAILLLTAWGHSFCKLRWPARPASRQHLAVAAAGACFGWTMWMAIRWEVVGRNGMSMEFLIFVLFSLPVLAFTALPLWHAIHRLRQPRLSLRMALGFIGVSIGMQCWGTMSVGEDPPWIFNANSVLIAVAVTLWLIVISLPAAKMPVTQNHE